MAWRMWKAQRSWGTILLAIWLILTGLLSLVDFQFPYAETVLPVLALVAGVLLLLGR